MKPTHKSVYKTVQTGTDTDGDPTFETVKTGSVCGQPGLYSSADWIAVDCAECLAALKPGEKA